MRLRTPTLQWPLVAPDPSAPRERRTASRLIAASAGLFVIGAAMALESRLPSVVIAVMAAAGVVPILWAVIAARRPAAKATGSVKKSVRNKI